MTNDLFLCPLSACSVPFIHGLFSFVIWNYLKLASKPLSSCRASSNSRSIKTSLSYRPQNHGCSASSSGSRNIRNLFVQTKSRPCHLRQFQIKGYKRAKRDQTVLASCNPRGTRETMDRLETSQHFSTPVLGLIKWHRIVGLWTNHTVEQMMLCESACPKASLDSAKEPCTSTG